MNNDTYIIYIFCFKFSNAIGILYISSLSKINFSSVGSYSGGVEILGVLPPSPQPYMEKLKIIILK